MGNASQTLQSFGGTIQAPEAREDAALDMTEDELALFHDNKPLLGAEDHIVVRYSAPSDADPVTTGSAPEEPGYATVSEIAIQEEKRKNKKERKISKKSFLKAISPKKESKTKKSTPSRAISGPELGFKPQFHSNPLMKYGGSIPPTPPPTPATAASTAPSDEGKYISTLLTCCRLRVTLLMQSVRTLLTISLETWLSLMHYSRSVRGL